ncbi:MAG: class I SAM-dependent methyltransferase [Armatimonadota bacterium]
MANEGQFKVNTRFVATRGVKEYRGTIAEWVNEDDVVLEIGCEWGTTTALIAPHCKEVIGTDISRECIERARREHPGIRFEVLDGFDVRAALDLGKQFTKVYIDISGMSGYRSLLDVIALIQMYATVLRPDAIIIKSGALKHFASKCIPWRSAARRGRGPGEARPPKDSADDQQQR